MTPFRALIAAFGLAVATAAAAAATPACSLLIDASASMEGYRHADHAPLMAEIDALRQRCPATSAFGDRLRGLAPGQPVEFKDQQTNIGPAVAEWADKAPDGSFVVIVTDNISDTRTVEGDATAKFYSLLRDSGSPFSHIVVMAVREAFDGKLYDPRNSAIQSHYRGPRALTLYILGKRAEGRDGDFRALRADVAAILGRTHLSSARGDDVNAFTVFDVKPFATEEFHINSTAANVRSDTAATTVKCSDKAHFDRATNTFLMPDQPMDQDCVLAADLMVRFADRWCLKNTNLIAQANIRNEDRAIFKPAVSADVTPSQANLCADDQKLTVTFRFSAYRFAENVGFFDKLARTFTGTFDATGGLDVYGTVERKNVTLDLDTNHAWSMASQADISVAANPDPAVQRRVFRLEEGVRAVIPEAELHNHPLAHYNIKATVRYEQWPIIVLLIVVLAAIALIVALFFFGAKPITYVVECDDGEHKLYLSAFGANQVESRGVILTLRHCVLFLIAGATGRIMRGGILPLAGGTVLVLPPGASVGRPARRKAGADSDEFGYSDSDFTDTGSPAPNDMAAERVQFTIRAERDSGPDRGNDTDESF